MVIEKDAVVVAAATVAVDGTVKAESPVLLRLTVTPAAPACFDIVTVQLLLALAPKVVGLHCSEVTTVAAERLTLTLCEVLL